MCDKYSGSSFEKFGCIGLLGICMSSAYSEKKFIVIFEIKQVQFSIISQGIKRLVIDKINYYSFRQLSEYCIVYRFPHDACMYCECFNFDSRKGVLGDSFIQPSSVCEHTRTYFYFSYE